MDNSGQHKDNSCKVLRWQKIKATLNNMSIEDFSNVIKEDSDAIILDVRTPEEYEEDRFENAINFNYLSRTLSDDIDKLNPNKSYYVYCKTGRRSIRICTLLKNSGFKKVFNLDQGLSDEFR